VLVLGGSNASLASNHSTTSLNSTSEFIQIVEQKESTWFCIDQ